MGNLKALILVATVAIIGVGLWFWWEHERIFPSTDDAYLKANIITISPQVGGRVETVAVVENQYVEAGDTFFQIDTSDLEANLQAARAQLEIARQNADASGANASSAEAQLQSALSALSKAEVEFDRTDALYKLGDVAQNALDQVTAARDQAAAAVDAARSAVDAARNQAGAAGDENASVQAALANLELARINLERSLVTAPVSGWVANLDLRPGALVEPGASLFSLVEDDEWWIDANFKETDLSRVRSGQPVEVKIDMYPGLSLQGTVDSIGAGSGAVFSLLPAQNATGNWVKVTQRFPVRIRLDGRPDDPAMQLRVGASTTATVDTSGLDASQ